MKKYLSFLVSVAFVLAIFLLGFNFNKQPVHAYDAGCTGSNLYSTATGKPCGATLALATSSALPAVTLSASPTTIPVGGSTTLTWSATNATSCTGSNAWAVTEPTSGSQVVTPPIPGTYTYSMTCTGPGGTSVPVSALVTVSGAVATPISWMPNISISVNPSIVTVNAEAKLNWSVTNAKSCFLKGPGVNYAPAFSGSLGVVTDAPGSFSYIMSCVGNSGYSNSGQASLVVVLPVASVPTKKSTLPTVTLVGPKTSITAGSSTTLTWSSTDATACLASNAWSGTEPTSGTQVVTPPIPGTYTYSMTCTGPGGTSVPVSATITADQSSLGAPFAKISSNPTTIPVGGSTTLTWSSENATYCTAIGGWSGTKETSGTQVVTPSTSVVGNTYYGLTCSGTGGTSQIFAAGVLTTGTPIAGPVLSVVRASSDQNAHTVTVNQTGNAILKVPLLTFSLSSQNGQMLSVNKLPVTLTSSAGNVSSVASKAYLMSGTTVLDAENIIGGNGTYSVVFKNFSSPVLVGSQATTYVVATDVNPISANYIAGTSLTANTSFASVNSGWDLSSGSPAGAEIAIDTTVIPSIAMGQAVSFRSSGVFVNETSDSCFASNNAQALTTSSMTCTITFSVMANGASAYMPTNSVVQFSAGSIPGTSAIATGTAYEIDNSNGVPITPSNSLLTSASTSQVGSNATLDSVHGEWIIAPGVTANFSGTVTLINVGNVNPAGMYRGYLATVPYNLSPTHSPWSSFVYLGVNNPVVPGYIQVYGSATTPVTTPTAPNAPTVTISASPTTVAVGDATTLTWSSTNATYCVLKTPTLTSNLPTWASNVQTNFSQQVLPPRTGANIFAITCFGSNGTSASASVTVTNTTTPTPTPVTTDPGCTGINVYSTATGKPCATTPPVLPPTTTPPIVTDPGCTGVNIYSTATGKLCPAPTPTSTPTATITVSPKSITYGGTATVSWSSTNATACALSGSDGTGMSNPGTSGSTTDGVLIKSGNVTYTIKCSNANGISASASTILTVTSPTTTPVTTDPGCTGINTYSTATGKLCAGKTTPTPTPAPTPNPTPTPATPTVTISVSPTSVTTGQSVTLIWSSTNTTYCTGSGGNADSWWAGTQPTSGTKTFTESSATQINYVINCGGASASTNLTVTAGSVSTPTLSFSPATVTTGSPTTLTWSSTNTTACWFTGGLVDSSINSGRTTNGTATITPSTAGTYNYNLTCSGSNGGTSTPASATLTVTAGSVSAPTLSFSPTTVVAGNPSTLTWSSTDTTSCWFSGNLSDPAINNTRATSGTATITPSAANTYNVSLTCSGSNGGTSAPASTTLTVTAGSVPTPTISFSPTTVVVGSPATLTWSSTDTTSCWFSGNFSDPAINNTRATSGTATITPSAANTYNVYITCLGSNGAKSTPISTTLIVTPAPAAPVVDATPASASVINATAQTASTQGGFLGWLSGLFK